ncbi:MAG: ADP-ribosylglycohydrolase family protein [Betaproteobacteria bacterium]|nr:ADP-ribosylglycohydrolase family protein [Betaproteobacteria bacterium]
MNSNIRLTPRIAAIMGALVADSASLGLHWLYDPSKIAQIEKNKGLTFLPPDDDNYADARGFFAHKNKIAGDSSGYGEACLLILKHYAKHGQFQRIEYQSEYRGYFGPGGEYIGYVDSPTRKTLHTLIPLIPDDFPEQSGADDDQFAALATIPVVTATHTGTQAELLDKIDLVVRLTNHNDTAVAAAKYTGTVLFEVINGKPITQALTDSLPQAGKKLAPLVEQALQTEVLDSVAMAEHFGSACHVLEGIPIVAHIMKHTSNYPDAIEANIRASGDNCGRAIMLGAIAAANAEQVGEPNTSIPLEWLTKYRKLSDAAAACAKI